MNFPAPGQKFISCICYEISSHYITRNSACHFLFTSKKKIFHPSFLSPLDLIFSFSFSCNSRKWMIEWNNHCFERNLLRKVVNKFSKIEQKKFLYEILFNFQLIFPFLFKFYPFPVIPESGWSSGIIIVSKEIHYGKSW